MAIYCFIANSYGQCVTEFSTSKVSPENLFTVHYLADQQVYLIFGLILCTRSNISNEEAAGDFMVARECWRPRAFKRFDRGRFKNLFEKWNYAL